MNVLSVKCQRTEKMLITVTQDQMCHFECTFPVRPTGHRVCTNSVHNHVRQRKARKTKRNCQQLNRWEHFIISCQNQMLKIHNTEQGWLFKIQDQLHDYHTIRISVVVPKCKFNE